MPRRSLFDPLFLPLSEPAEPLRLWELLAMQGMFVLAVGAIQLGGSWESYSQRQISALIAVTLAFLVAPLMVRDGRRGPAARFSGMGRWSLLLSEFIALFYLGAVRWAHLDIHYWGHQGPRYVDRSCVVCVAFALGMAGIVAGLFNLILTWDQRRFFKWIPLVVSLALTLSIPSLGF